MRPRRVRDIRDRSLEAHDSITRRGLAAGNETTAQPAISPFIANSAHVPNPALADMPWKPHLHTRHLKHQSTQNIEDKNAAPARGAGHPHVKGTKERSPTPATSVHARVADVDGTGEPNRASTRTADKTDEQGSRKNDTRTDTHPAAAGPTDHAGAPAPSSLLRPRTGAPTAALTATVGGGAAMTTTTMSGRGSPRLGHILVGRDAGDLAGARGGVAGGTYGRLKAAEGEGARDEGGLVGGSRALVAGREAVEEEESDDVDAGKAGVGVGVVVVALVAAPGGPGDGGGRLRGSRGEGRRRSWWGRWGKGRGRRKVRNWQASIENAVADHRGNRDRYLATTITSQVLPSLPTRVAIIHSSFSRLLTKYPISLIRVASGAFST